MRLKKDKSNKKSLFVMLIICLIFLSLGLILALNKTNTTQSKKTTEETKQVSFLAVGDIIAHDSVNDSAYDKKTKTYDYTAMFNKVQQQITTADLAFANQETISTTSKGISGYPAFNAPFSLIDSLTKTGFDLISLANNHATDVSNSAPQETATYYQENYPKVKVSGSNASCEDINYQQFEKNNISFTFNAFTYGVNNTDNLQDCNINLINDENYHQQIKDLTATGDVNIVSLHFGEENNPDISQEEEQIVNELLDAGVEIILGTHPHVLKPIVKTTNAQGNDALIAYSLGNFLSTQLEDNQRLGGMLEFDITLTDKVTISNIKFTPTFQYYTWDDATHEDLRSRKNVEIIYLPEVSELETETYYLQLVELVKTVIDEQYLTYLPPQPYTNISYINSADFTTSTIVNKNNCLQEDYEPNDLVIPNVALSTRTTKDVHYISQSIETNIQELFNNAQKAGYNLIFVSGYRSYATQKTLYNNYVNSDGVAQADIYSARPGCSEHQTGIGFDISEQSIDAQGVGAFNDTEAAKWVKENAHKYGFIIRYPEDKIAFTQYTYESWHLRYVGQNIATAIYKQNLSLEEYMYEQNK
ncbi:MAG: CapA family protein [Mycoplasmatales bacterium]